MHNKAKAFIFAGANASGKSTLIAHLLQEKIIVGTYVNPDLVLKNELKLEETKANYLLAFDIAQKKREQLFQKGIYFQQLQPFIYFTKDGKYQRYQSRLFQRYFSYFCS